MSIKQTLFKYSQAFVNFVEKLFKDTAIKMGYPDNPGMPIVTRERFNWTPSRLSEKLPILYAPFPPDVTPKNYIHVLIGDFPKPLNITKYYYQNPEEGYYNFYLQNYQNIFFLPNEISEFLQIRLNFCVDLTFLEVSREVIFFLLVVYYHIINIRVLIGWFISINPYTFPLTYFVALVDWSEDVTLGLSPSLAGVNLITSVLLMIVGKIADSVNYLVFTMPYLPSEGVPAKAFIEGELKDVLLFRYLPILWYKYPIPNDIREFWFNEQTDVLLFMQKAYENLDIQFLPDRVLPLI